MTYEEKLKAFAVQLFKINAIKFGEYKTKSGLMTPVYCDLRLLVSYPKILEALSDLIIESTNDLKSFNVICGVPYTALPIATSVSIKADIPMVMRRKEAKDYGTKKVIEGSFSEGDKCLIIEDVVTSGSSILETVKDLSREGLKTTDAIVLLNREQGGEQFLKENGITMRALLKMTQLMKILEDEGCIDEATCLEVKDYLQKSQIPKVINEVPLDRLKMKYEDRAAHSSNPIAKRLFKLMAAKKTNLCVAVDLRDSTDLLNVAIAVGPHICLLKTHIDIIEAFNWSYAECLLRIAKQHNFLLLEDRKFSDIGMSVQMQYSKGLYHISSWAPLVTVHSLTGEGVLTAIKEADGLKERGVFVLAETSAKGNLIDDKYAANTVKMGKKHEDLVAGFVCQSKLFVNEPGFIQLTPGVQIDVNNDALGQQYSSPESVVLERGADIAVVGRGITLSPGVVGQAELYRKLLWEAYLKRIQ